MKKCIVVLGVHRGGTSIVSCLLHNLGVDMGEVFMPPDERNEIGFFEDIEFLYLHDKIIGGNWEKPLVSFLKHEQEYLDLLENYKNKTLWGIKDPKMCLFFHQFLRVMNLSMPNTEILVIDVERDVDAVAKSLTNKNKWPGNLDETTAKKITKQYIFCKNLGLKFFDGKILKLKHSDLCNTPESEIKKLCEFINVPFLPKVISLVSK